MARGIYVDHRHLILKPCKLQSLEDHTSQQVGWLHQHMAVWLYNFNLPRRFIHHLHVALSWRIPRIPLELQSTEIKPMRISFWRLLAPFDPLKRAVSNTWKKSTFMIVSDIYHLRIRSKEQVGWIVFLDASHQPMRWWKWLSSHVSCLETKNT